jgi:predicted GIY-YIG superfamily endonuclease
MADASVYRLFDAEDRLLYVGSTKCVERRLGQHRSAQPWFGDVTRTEVEEFPSCEAALEGELEAIRQELPLHNRRGIPPKLGAQRLKLRDAERKHLGFTGESAFGKALRRCSPLVA